MRAAIDKVDVATLRASASQACALLKVLANRDRLLLLCQLAEGEHCVSELEELTRVKQPTLSQQLTVLRVARLVDARRQGKQIFYRLASEKVIAVMRVLYEQFCKGQAKGRRR